MTTPADGDETANWLHMILAEADDDEEEPEEDECEECGEYDTDASEEEDEEEEDEEEEDEEPHWDRVLGEGTTVVEIVLPVLHNRALRLCLPTPASLARWPGSHPCIAVRFPRNAQPTLSTDFAPLHDLMLRFATARLHLEDGRHAVVLLRTCLPPHYAGAVFLEVACDAQHPYAVLAFTADVYLATWIGRRTPLRVERIHIRLPTVAGMDAEGPKAPVERRALFAEMLCRRFPVAQSAAVIGPALRLWDADRILFS